MLPTFVIGLREGLEAALIVGIVAAFLRQRGRLDLLRWVLVGVATAVALCLAAGIALDVWSRDLPQRQQEGLETVIGAVAVVMVTYMVVWMRRHSRDLKGQLEGAAGSALVSGSGWALVAMAFLAVIREGLETVVFLLAAFNEAGQSWRPGSGRSLGIAVAVALGSAIYRGGVQHQPLEVLPRHRPGARARGRRAGRHALAHRARGRLAELRPAGDGRPDLAGHTRVRCRPRCSPACSASSRIRC